MCNWLKTKYQKYFWKKEDYWAHLYGMKRKWFESDEKLRKRIEDSVTVHRVADYGEEA